MNRPKRPVYPSRRPNRPAPTGSSAPAQAPRRRSPLDSIPALADGTRLRVLGSGADRQALMAAAHPLEMVVIQGYTREIEDAFMSSGVRVEDFWQRHSELIETVKKLDEIFAGIMTRVRGS